MVIATVYRVISKSNNTMKVMRDSKRVADFLLARYQMGKGLNSYIIIKSDKTGDRIIRINRSDATLMEKTIEEA